MNRFIHVTLLLTAVALWAGCSREPSPEASDTAVVRLSASLGETRATVAATDAEKAVNHIDWFAFDADGALVDAHRGTAPTETFTLSKGDYSFMAVANLPVEAPAVGSASLSEYRAALETSFADSFLGSSWVGFVMGSPAAAVSLTTDKDVLLDMERTACKVVLEGGVSFDIPAASSIASLSREVKCVFLTNIPDRVGVFTGEPDATVYANDASAEDFVPRMLSAAGVPTAAMSPYTYSLGAGAATVYGHPNADVQSDDPLVQDMTTKLVVCAEIGGELMFYPVSLPGITSNCIVTLSGVTITGRGSQRPNDYLTDDSAVRFSVTLTPWTREAEECILIRER